MEASLSDVVLVWCSVQHCKCPGVNTCMPQVGVQPGLYPDHLVCVTGDPDKLLRAAGFTASFFALWTCA